MTRPAIQIISEKLILDGTAYVEILPGGYKGECWGDESIFLDEESFGFLEKIISKHVPNYDHYAFMEVDSETWDRILMSLEGLLRTLDNATDTSGFEEFVCFYFDDTESEFNKRFVENKQQLKNMVAEFVEWAREKLESYENIAILGL